jgi:hypothetical protein
MRRLTLSILALLLVSSSTMVEPAFKAPIQELKAIPLTSICIDNDKLVDALIHVESSGNDSAYCVSEDAVGCLQIRKTMIRDVNRILKHRGDTTKYKMKDRWNRIKSVEIFNIYCEHYKLTSPEAKARCWNGGPRGLTKKATQKYWDKVNKELNK